MDVLAEEELRTCLGCKNLKPLSEFGPNKNSRGGRLVQCRPCMNEKALAWRHANPDKVAVYAQRGNLRRYGISPEERDRLVEAQNGRCAICGVWPEGEGSVGLLHNVGLGHFRDDPDLLRLALLYLEAS